MSPSPTAPPIRKVAILLASLDAEAADEILRQLDADTVTQVRHCLADLHDVDRDEQEQVIAEFLGGRRMAQAAAVEVDDSLARRLADPGDSASIEPVVHPTTTYFPWSSLPARTLARCLAEERPQIVAVVLAHLPPAQAAEVLHALPAPLQSDVLPRLARVTSVPPELLNDIAQAIESRLSALERLDPCDPPGQTAVRAILEAADEKSREQWRASLQFDSTIADDPSVAVVARDDEPKSTVAAESSREMSRPPRDTVAASPSLSSLRELLKWDDIRLAGLLRSADPLVVVLALAGADPDVAQKLEARLAPTTARELRRRLAQLGPWRLEDAHRAERELLRIANHFAASEGRATEPRLRRAA